MRVCMVLWRAGRHLRWLVDSLRLEPTIDELAASTLGEVYAQVYQDLNDAIENFQASGLKREANDNYSPNLDVAYAVFARAALTRQDWDNAANSSMVGSKRNGKPREAPLLLSTQR